MVVMLRQCCCGCTLKTGTIIVGVFNVIGGLANLIQGIAAASVGDSIGAQSKNTIIALGVVLAVIGAILLLVAICLIVGAQKDNPVLLMPWMVYSVVSLIVGTVLYIVNDAQYFEMGWSNEGTGYIVGAVIYILLHFYFLVVVYSLYRDLKGPHNKQTTQQHRRGQQLGRVLPNTRNQLHFS